MDLLPVSILNHALLPFVSRATVLPHLKSVNKYLHKHLNKDNTLPIKHGIYVLVGPQIFVMPSGIPTIVKETYEEGLMVCDHVYRADKDPPVLVCSSPYDAQGMIHGIRKWFFKQGGTSTQYYFEHGTFLERRFVHV